MVVGYRGNPSWRDMSDFLVHFTHTKDELKQIFDDACVKASGPFGAAKGIGSPALPPQKSVCLSEIPLDYLDRLVDRHGSYGIGFRKAWAIEKNATRVWYLDKDSAVADKVVDWAQAGGPGAWEDDPIYSLTPFIDYVGTFNGVRHEFEWEREWRVNGDLAFMFPRNVPFIFVPESEIASVSNVLAINPLSDFEVLQQQIAQL